MFSNKNNNKRNNLKIIASFTLTGGLLAAAGAGIAKTQTSHESSLDVLYAGLMGMGAGLILSTCGLLTRKIYQACAQEEMSLASPSSDAESSDGDECARDQLRKLLDAWREEGDEESLSDKDSLAAPFYSAMHIQYPQSQSQLIRKF